MDVDVIIDDEPLLEREDRPRSHTWPILPPPPIETIHEDVVDAEVAQQQPVVSDNLTVVENGEKSSDPPRKNSRKNAWGNLSYADLITQAIQSSPEQRLTLSQIYEWMVTNIPYFKDKGDSTSSAGWKNSIRHNLSLHSRFMRVQNDNNGKSSYWVINPDAKPGKSSRRRSGSVDEAPKTDKPTKRSRSKKLAQSTDDISTLSPNSMRPGLQNHSCENLYAGGSSPCSSTDSLKNVDDYTFATDNFNRDNFNRPRSTSNVSTQSSVNGGRLTPIQSDADVEDDYFRLPQLDSNGNQMVVTATDETANLVESMTLTHQGGCNRTADTINLDDSLKMMGSENQYNGGASFGEAMMMTRVHSDSFGSGDSGYDSPAYFSPPLPQTTVTGRMRSVSSPILGVGGGASQVSAGLSNGIPITVQNGMPNVVSNGVVPNKPPPPYTNHYPPQMRQPTYSNQCNDQMQVPNFYNQQHSPNSQVSPNAQPNQVNQPNYPMNQSVPNPIQRLQHLPMTNNTYQPNMYNSQAQMMQQQRNRSLQQQANAHQQQIRAGIAQGAYPSNAFTPNVSLAHKGMNPAQLSRVMAMKQYQQMYQQQQQQQQQSQMVQSAVNGSVGLKMEHRIKIEHDIKMEQDFPADIISLELHDFSDQQQLANDIDAIIKSDMGTNNLESVFDPSSYPVNCNTYQTMSTPTPMSYMQPGQGNWVR